MKIDIWFFGEVLSPSSRAINALKRGSYLVKYGQ
ncbi:hypothetical protein OROHE_011054 [Orobanche hederae]